MSKNKKSGIGKFVLGAAVGAGLGLLFAPKKGSETRKDLKKKFDELVAKIKEIDVEEVKNEFFQKVDAIKLELEDLDKERALKIAKEKGEDLKKKTEELLALAKEKGTPALEKAARDLKDRTIDALKEIINKLEASK